MEEWKQINGYPNYMVSNLGKVINTKKNVLMTAYLRKGYCLVKLSRNNIPKEMKLHRLVAIAFVDNPNNYNCINHKDEDKSNNRFNNLQWCNHEYNNNYGNHNKKISESLKENHKKGNFYLR